MKRISESALYLRSFRSEMPPRYALAMRFCLLLLLCVVSISAVAQSTLTPLRRTEYAQESFSIAVPSTWSEIEPSALAAASAALPRVAANLPEIKIKHGFKATSGVTFPWVAIILTYDRVDETVFETMGLARRTVDELTKKWESSGGTLQSAAMKDMSYDKVHHILWGVSRSTFSGVGDLQTLSGAYLTKTGSIQVHCYSMAAEFGRYNSMCKQIIESVMIAPEIALPAGAVK